MRAVHLRTGAARSVLAALTVLLAVLLALGVRAVTAGDDAGTVAGGTPSPGSGLASGTASGAPSSSAPGTGAPSPTGGTAVGSAVTEPAVTASTVARSPHGKAGRGGRAPRGRAPEISAADLPELRALAEEVRQGVKRRSAEQRHQDRERDREGDAAPLPAPLPTPTPLPTTATFRVGTLNVLGASHTTARGNKPRYGSAAARMPLSLALIRRSALDVVGLQEFQAPQYAAFRRATAGAWSVFPGLSRTRKAVQNSIAFRSDTWRLEQGLLVDIPYFHGRPFPMPLVLLTHRASGHRVWFVNVHNPANTHGDASRHRARAIAIEAALVDRLHRDGTPVVLTGDFNDRADAFCPLVGRTALEASNGGSVAGGCRLPGASGIDWIFATSDLDVLDHERERSALVRRATDHPFVHATLTLTAVPD